MKSPFPTEFLNYHHLRYFWAVARAGSLKKAAESLSVSQPSMCTQIKQLEAALGEALFRVRGRTTGLTEFGQLIFGYAEEIFELGSEVLQAAKQTPGSRKIRLNVGIVDSFPKLISFEMLKPIFDHEPRIHLTCHEGKLPDLLTMLSTHRMDMVLADEPAASNPGCKVFNHLAKTSSVSFFAMPQLARKLRGRFPQNLHQAPMLLPTHHCTLRRELEHWFESVGIEPSVVAEFEDAALAKIVATEGVGVVVVPTLVEREVVERYGLVSVGRSRGITSRFYAITAERRLTHPAIQAIVRRAKSRPRTTAK